MTYIVHGATGAQGKPLYNNLISQGYNAVAALRNPYTDSNKSAIQVNLDSVESLITAYHGVDGVFIHLPLGSEEQRMAYANNIVDAIKIAQPKRVVISTSGWKLGIPGDKSALPQLIEGVQNTGVSTAVIAPQLYLENLLLPVVINEIKQDHVLAYPLPHNFPVSWCSHLDIADVAARLLTDSTITGVIEVGQLPGLTGTELAQSFSKYLSSIVSYQSLTPEEFGKRLAPLFGEDAAKEVAMGYEAKLKTDSSTISEDLSAQKLLNLKPRTIQEWLQDMNI